MKKTKMFSDSKLLISIVSLTCLLLSSSCKSGYYLCHVYEPVSVYKEKSSSQPSFIIPAEKQLIVETGRKKFRRIKFGNSTGYVQIKRFPNEWKYSPEDLKYLVFNSDSIYYDSRYSSSAPTRVPSTSSESTNTSSGGTVHVKGYYRKDGTYVRPHTRSAPRRNK